MTGSNCLDSQAVLSGQMGLISDVAVSKCKSYEQTESTHQCLTLTNPFQSAARAFDVTDNQFVLSPIAYFPLVIKVGTSPTRVASINDRTFVLDPAQKAIFEIKEKLESPKDPIKSLDFTPDQWALVLDSANKIWALVVENSASVDIKVHALALDSDSKFSTTLENVKNIDFVTTNLNQTSLLITQSKNLYVLAVSDLISKSDSLASTPNNTFDDAVQAIAASDKEAWLSLSDKTLKRYDWNSKQILASANLEALGAQIYLPESLVGTPNTCCGGKANWLAVLLTNGKLQYWPYDSKSIGPEPENVSIQSGTGIESLALTQPIKLLGANAEGHGNDGLDCDRRLFLVYTGSLFVTCEGSQNIRYLDRLNP